MQATVEVSVALSVAVAIPFEDVPQEQLGLQAVFSIRTSGSVYHSE
jgi:hypothetical protein